MGTEAEFPRRDDGGGDGGLSGQVGEVLAAVTAGADALLALADEPVDGEEAGALLVALHAQRERLSAGLARLAGRFRVSMVWAGDDSKSPGAWLAYRCRAPKDDADRLFLLGRDLRAMPRVEAALSAGEIGVCHARALATLRRKKRLTEAFIRDEDTLVDLARSLEWPGFCRELEYWRYRVDPDGGEQQAARDEEDRRLHLSDGLYGSGILDGELTPVAREIVGNELDVLDDELFRADWADARDRLGREPSMEDLTRTPAQRRHDALVQMATNSATQRAGERPGRTPAPLFTALVGLESLERMCELATRRTVVTPGALAPYVDRALIERIVFDTNARPFEVGETRLFRGALRRAIQARDRECQHHGCHVPARFCEVDHIDPYSRGGPTTEANGQLRCGFHNRRKGNTPPQAA